MATATAARDPKRSDGGPIRQYKAGVDILYGGCLAVIDNTSSGYLLDGDAARADNIFAGVVCETVDNSSPASAGDKSVRVWTAGEFEFVIAATADQTYVGQAAYLLYNNEVTLTPGTYSIYIGQITEFVSTTKVRVRIDTSLAEGVTAGQVLNAGTTQPLRVFAGEGAFTTTATTAAVSAGGLTVVVAAIAGHIGDSAAAAAQGQLGFTEDGSTGQAEVSGGNVTVNRVDGSVSGAKFNYILLGY